MLRRPKRSRLIAPVILILSGLFSFHSSVYGQAQKQKPQTIQQLIKQLDNKNQSLGDVPVEWTEAVLALSRMGKTAVPPLIAALKNKSPHVRRGAARALMLIGVDAAEAIPALAEAANDEDLETSVRAIGAMGFLGSGAIPHLMKVIRDETKNVTQLANAGSALGRIGKPAIPALLEAMKDNDKEFRVYVLGALGMMGPNAREAVPALEAIARGDSDRKMRRWTLSTLQKIDPGADAAVSELFQAVQNKEKNLQERLQAIDTLAIFRSTKDRKTVPVFSKLSAVLALVMNDADNDIRLRRKAASVLGRIRDKAAVPALTEALENESLFSTALYALKRSGPQDEVLIPALITVAKGEEVEPRMRRKAIYELGRIGANAKSALPAIVELLKKDEFRRAAINALRRIDPDNKALVSAHMEATQAGTLAERRAFVRRMASQRFRTKAAIPALIKALKDEDEQVRGGAVRALGKMGTEAVGAIPGLAEILKDVDTNKHWIRQEAFIALARIGKAAVPALIELLKNKDKEVRWMALNSLSNIRREANEAIPALIEMMKDKSKDPTERGMAASALSSVGPGAEPVIPQLIEILENEKEPVRVRSGAAAVLGSIGPAAESAIPALMKVLKHENRLFRERVAGTLARIAPDKKEVVNALVESMKDKESRRASAYALGRIGTSALPSLIEALKHSDKNVRVGAIQGLNELGPKAEPAAPALMEALKDEEPGVRSGAAHVLGRIGQPAKQAVPGLIGLLEDEDRMVRRSAAYAMGRIKPESDVAVPPLLKALKDQDKLVRSAVVDALGGFGSAAVPALAERLTDQVEDVSVRRRAVNALRKMGPEAKAAAPAFIEALKDFDGYVRHEAMKALGRLGPDARPAIPILMKELENPRLHNAAIATLMGIVVLMQRVNHPDTKQLVETLKNAFANHPDPKIQRYVFAVEDMVRRENQRVR